MTGRRVAVWKKKNNGKRVCMCAGASARVLGPSWYSGQCASAGYWREERGGSVVGGIVRGCGGVFVEVKGSLLERRRSCVSCGWC